MSGLATRYVGGATAEEAVATAQRLAERDIRSSLFYLGEYVDSDDLVAENVGALKEVCGRLAETELDLHISVDPTQVGCAMDWDQGAEAVMALGDGVRAAAGNRPGVHCLMLDMEDFSVNERTLALHGALRAAGAPAAQTLQAYLKKTMGDMDALIQQGAKVRLVKGAFAAPPSISFATHAEIKANYKALIDRMLSPDALESGFYPIFGTHDHTLHQYAIETARRVGWPQGAYEFEMLYGARPDVADALAAAGERIRLYLPFGRDWWPYAVRRVGENPGSAILLARSLMN
ncbi:MAG: proline dehydrogenase family protein [Pseudomonadota bacterium]